MIIVLISNVRRNPLQIDGIYSNNRITIPAEDGFKLQYKNTVMKYNQLTVDKRIEVNENTGKSQKLKRICTIGT